MTYELEFDARALKEWHELGDTVRQQFKKKLVEILINPRIEASRLHGLPVDRRERDEVYRKADDRLSLQGVNSLPAYFVRPALTRHAHRPPARPYPSAP